VDRLTRQEIEYLVGQFALLAAKADWKPKSIDRIRAFGDLALSALSQEAVRDEALEEVVLVCEAYANEGDRTAKEYVHETVAELIARFRALKREPNAATQGNPTGDVNALTVTPSRPAPAAPDVTKLQLELDRAGRAVDYGIEGCRKLCRQAAALLAKLGQDESTDSLDGRRYRYLRSRGCGRQFGEPESCWLELGARDLDLAIDAAILPLPSGASDEIR
jgi:hypothetical protein